MEKYFILIQPDDFYSICSVDRIVIFDEERNEILNDVYNAKNHLLVKKLMVEGALFITYNGDLLSRMLWQFWGYNEYKNIIDLMEQFAVIYGKYKYWETEDGECLYIWQKLKTALKYYNLLGYKISDCKVNIKDPYDALKKTIILYDCMKDWEEKQILKDIEKG